MSLLTSSAGGILTPEQVNALVVVPVQRASVIYQASQLVVTRSKDYRFPILSEDPSAAWVLEGEEIPIDDAVVDELVVTPKKVAGLQPISRELATDSLNESAAETLGAALARDIAKRVDQAAFKLDTPANAPAGLHSLADHEISVVDATAGVTNLDPFAEGISLAEQQGAVPTAWVASPTTALQLAKLKREADSNEQLLQPDPTLPTRRAIAGVPLLVSPAVEDFEIWGIPGTPDTAGAFSFVVQAQEATLDVDKSVYFTSDRLAIRATLRVAFGWPHTKAVVRIDLPDGS
ncbi:phage major capsid protein [Mycolicibacterium fortuitum]|uniref:phage major capsid protein n=1 Tax=Mycolicibacterium fortuitum TaxID=1766 RepID=UPI0007E952A4|nr:phage major capsid protein [Mycolicibacterium fortuitum]OBG50181.1 hypothetical protein A5670_26425 [Mycolicibacterium fortuitum]